MAELLIKFLKNDKVERALKTFFEAFFSYLIYAMANTDLSSKEALKGVILGAISSAISVVINSFKKPEEIEEFDYLKDDEDENL